MSPPIQTSTDQATNHWAIIKEAGTLKGMRFLLWVYRIFGRWIFSMAMYPVALYFVIFRSEQRRASFDFLRQHYQQKPHLWKSKPHYGHVLLHFKTFAEVILDKLLGWITDIDEDNFALSSPAMISELMQDTRGQLIIGSHFGNLEYCRGFMQRYKSKTINILLYDKHSSNFVEIMKKESQDSRLNVFQVDEFDVTTILTLQEKIANGEWVFIAGDRIPLSGLERTIEVNFLGKPACLPVGPYMLAKALGCPVKMMFAYRHSSVNNHIIFDVVPLTDKVVLSPKQKMKNMSEYAQQFADQLQEHVLKAPYQWFNFYDFWHSPPSSQTGNNHSLKP